MTDLHEPRQKVMIRSDAYTGYVGESGIVRKRQQRVRSTKIDYQIEIKGRLLWFSEDELEAVGSIPDES
jgi:hypothetical protein